ncbi:MAG: D-alanine--D-alanine ligase [Pirellulales bacterium]|nr:D-alanine--D-alanine ligase [Pirellulales bacterium]
MRVGVLHNAVAPGASKAEEDVLVQVEAVSQALESLGHQPSSIPCTLDLEAARRRLTEAKPDVVFNLVEALGGSDWLSFLAPALLDATGLPYTGSSTAAMMISTHKLLSKERLCQAGLPTPAWLVVPKRRAAVPAPVFRPGPVYILKAVTEHASFGLDEHSLATPADEAALLAELERTTAELGQECFAEEYIDGREFNLSVLAGPDGPEVLPPAEIDFSAFPAGKPRIVGQRAKWEEASFEYTNTPRRFDFPASERPLVERLQSLARQCWLAFGLGGYARVDFRVDPAGEPWILEVNANPCLSPDAGFAAALQQASLPFASAVARILDGAAGRLSRPSR